MGMSDGKPPEQTTNDFIEDGQRALVWGAGSIPTRYPYGHPGNFDRHYEEALRSLIVRKRKSGTPVKSCEYLFERLDGLRACYLSDLTRSYEQGQSDERNRLLQEIRRA